MDKLLPWPSRAERRAAITKAREGKEQAGLDLEHAQGVQRDIQRDAYGVNHFAQLMAAQIIAGRHGKQE